MQLVDLPTRIQIPFANGASITFVNPIPVSSQQGSRQGRASFTDGFPPLCFQSISEGGIPPFGSDVNGILQTLSAWARWQSVGGSVPFDATFAAFIGGYPQSAVVRSAVVYDVLWLNTVDGNTTDPDSFGQTTWTTVDHAPGDVVRIPFGDVRTGLWCLANAQSIGNVGSGATIAAAFTKLLYRSLWTNFPNSQCPVLPGGRGANPDADFAAGKTIQLLDYCGTGDIAVDTMGNTGRPTTRLSGVPITAGSATAPGSLLGENLHVLTQAQLPAVPPTGTVVIHDPGHTHATSPTTPIVGTGSVLRGQSSQLDPTGPQVLTLTSAATRISAAFSGANLGSSQGHNTVQRSFANNVWLKF